MNTFDSENSLLPAVILIGTLTLPVGARHSSHHRRNKQPIEKWSKRIHKKLAQCGESKKTIIIVISSKKKQNKTPFDTKASLLHCPSASCNVTKALLLANKIDRKNDPLRTLGYTKKCDKQRVYLEALYR